MRKQLFVSVFILVWNLFFFHSPLLSQGKEVGSRSETKDLHIGYPANAFSKGYIADIQVALDLWAEKLVEKYDETLNVTTAIYEDGESIEGAIIREEVDHLVLGSLDYLNIEKYGNMDPISVENSGKNVCQEFILLSKRDKGFNTIQKLEGREILTDIRAVGKIPEMWLDVLLSKQGLADKQIFFKDFKTVEKASQAVLPVYFDQADACIIMQSSFETLCELNPRLNQELIIMYKSPSYLRGLTCLRKNLDPELKEKVRDVIFSMEEHPEGQQILMLLQVENIMPYKSEYLDTIRLLAKEHKALGDKSEK